jgi:hypothetical protein
VLKLVHNLHTQGKESAYQCKGHFRDNQIEHLFKKKKKLQTAKQVHEQQDIHQLKHPKYSKQSV